MNAKQLSILNKKIGHFEKNFLINTEVGNVKQGHMVYATVDNFPGLVKAMGDPGQNGANIKRELTLIVWCVDMATRSLNIEDI